MSEDILECECPDDDSDDWDPDDNDETWALEDNPCDHCGPRCKNWGGDGLCMLQINALADESQDFEENFVKDNQECPICHKKLTQYEIPTDNLWEWPGDFYNSIIALNIYAVMDAPKGEIHHSENLYHIYVGDGEYREEKLILLTGDNHAEDLPF